MPVEIRSSPSDRTVNESDTEEFVCEAVGLPAPTFTWSTPDINDLNDVAPDELSINSTNSLFNDAVLVRSVLRFTSIQRDNSNQYTCTASNTPIMDQSFNDSASFNVTVQCKSIACVTCSCFYILWFSQTNSHLYIRERHHYWCGIS